MPNNKVSTKKELWNWQVAKEFSTFSNFSFSGINVGIKDKSLDLALATCATKAKAASLFTKNSFPGAPLVVAKEDIFSEATPYLKAIIVNSKNANVFTGKDGEQDVRDILQTLTSELKIKKKEAMMSSTGIIGKKLPKQKIKKKIATLCKNLNFNTASQKNFANAILTTDSKPKYAVAHLYHKGEKLEAKILGIAKGAGMIEPNMATMLVYLFTNIKLPGKKTLKTYLAHSAALSFEHLSIDGDTSTSDTVLLLNDESFRAAVPSEIFQQGLNRLCVNLTKQIIKDGEGKHKAIHLLLSGATSGQQADLLAKSILNSILVKTALHGGDPNWGRLVMAVGKVSRFKIAREDFFIRFFNKFDENFASMKQASKKNWHCAFCEKNNFVEINNSNFNSQSVLKKAAKKLQAQDIYMEVGVGKGDIMQNYWGSALGEEYMRFNSAYTT